KNLPLSSMAYDVFSISGQGTGGMFRPFRNDIGSVYDPEVKSPKHTNTSALIEGGIGNLFELGTDIAFFDNEANSGPWQRLHFRGSEQGSLYEKVFFKQAGELTYNNQQVAGIYNDDAVYLKDDLNQLFGKGRSSKGNMPSRYGDAYVYSSNDRTSRSNLLTFLTAEEASIAEIAEYQKIRQFEKFGVTGSTAFYNPNAPTLANRSSEKDDENRAHQISEFTQTLGDGRRYIYGIPAMNNMSREVTFSINGAGADLNTGLVAINGQEYGSNLFGKEGFYSSTSTPAYAHSYLLTSVLSAEYVDVLGDGPTDDDLGNWVKFNYTLWDGDYRWRTPYESDKAQYQPGFWSDSDDDKGSVVMGSRQQWHIRSIESKNYVAEFYVSKREDGMGVQSAILPSNSTYDNAQNYKNTKGDTSFSYKLDSIKLFNKHDRLINTTTATPIKTVIFKYATSGRLCKGLPNAVNDGGKLTLEKIYIKYGSSQKNLLSPYSFTYGNYDSTKHAYNYANKDRWGNFKDNSLDGTLTNYEFPYVKQDGDNLDADAAPYELTEIRLPSGGIITVNYESDDYSFVQDRRTMQMFKIYGVGNSEHLDGKNTLYDNPGSINDYIYFERVIEKENPNRSLRENYLEGAEYLYYSFNMDITGTGQYDYVKGYAKIVDVGKCDDTAYGYVRVRKERAGGNSSELLHPATIYGINLARYYLPHRINPGFNSGGGPINILQGLLA
ncbi:MAG TPA: hypothetical protein VEB40_04605, partial [Flavipsychrobacter sp.]|nr:hypothetical protein [Flavipsychrobacter sp.]